MGSGLVSAGVELVSAGATPLADGWLKEGDTEAVWADGRLKVGEGEF
jgi:hypothetical protein